MPRSTNLWSLVVQVRLLYRGLFFWSNWVGYLSNTILRPLLLICMYSLLGRLADSSAAAQQYAIGIAAFSMSWMLLGGITQSFAYTRILGTLPELYSSPAPRFTHFLARLLPHIPNALLAFVCSLAFAVLLVQIPLTNVTWSLVISSVVITALSLMAYAAAVGVVALMMQEWHVLLAGSNGVLLLFAGVVIPVPVFPEVLQYFSDWLPMTHGLAALRAGMAGADFAATLTPLMRELGSFVLYLSVGFAGFLGVEHLARKRGLFHND